MRVKRRQQDVAEGLPSFCYAKHPTMEKAIIVLYKGESVFEFYDGPRSTVDALNKVVGVTQEQREAMLVGSLFGWNAPAADPKYWKGKVL